LAAIAAQAMFLLDFDERIKRRPLSSEFDDMQKWAPVIGDKDISSKDTDISPITMSAIDESRQHKTDHYEDF